LLNSIYGKTILKPFEINVKMIKKEASDTYVCRHYNSIEKYEEVFGSKFVKIDEIKNIHKHFVASLLTAHCISQYNLVGFGRFIFVRLSRFFDNSS
jgi:hypothetical protein